MRWQFHANHPWQPPLDAAAPWRAEDMALLYSSRTEHFSGQQSFLLLDPLATVEGARWEELPPLPATADNLPYWVGHLSYELGDAVPSTQPAPVNLPLFRLTRYGRLLHFNHETNALREYRMEGHTPPSPMSASTPAAMPEVTALHASCSRDHYMQTVSNTLEQIAAGHFYQANLTRKFHGRFGTEPDYFTLFTTLCSASPAAFSAYMRHGSSAILSSSPESFLSIDASGHMVSRPIKGSAPRGQDEAEDAAIRTALQNSAKNQAENLMIVDLMRHDLSQVSQPGSVKVAEQSGLYSYATIHHLVSTVTAQKQPGKLAYDVARACFPPGSMTGAPKIAAMRWCAAQEAVARGVYSGALGWFGGGDTCDLSVVIRTLVCQGNAFEFQVGGGIVADSTPEEEWRETLVKARGIGKALGIREEALAAL